jgi:hypothetical protein
MHREHNIHYYDNHDIFLFFGLGADNFVVVGCSHFGYSRSCRYPLYHLSSSLGPQPYFGYHSTNQWSEIHDRWNTVKIGLLHLNEHLSWVGARRVHRAPAIVSALFPSVND